METCLFDGIGVNTRGVVDGCVLAVNIEASPISGELMETHLAFGTK